MARRDVERRLIVFNAAGPQTFPFRTIAEDEEFAATAGLPVDQGVDNSARVADNVPVLK